MKAIKTTAAVAILAVAGVAALGWAAGTDRAALAKKQETLNAEYGLAKEAKFYFVFDVLGRKIELRVRGMVLRTWPIESMRFWGKPDFTGAVELVKKTTLKAPERIVIKPGETETPAPAPAATTPAPAANPAEFQLEALELKDMPTRFGLDLDNGLHISIRARTGGSPGMASRLRDAWRWYIALPLRDLTASRRSQGFSELELVFADGKDPQSIYWHLFDGIKGIIL